MQVKILMSVLIFKEFFEMMIFECNMLFSMNMLLSFVACFYKFIPCIYYTFFRINLSLGQLMESFSDQVKSSGQEKIAGLEMLESPVPSVHP